MKIFAILPARGGSKGIPKKNTRILAGKPLIAHTIESAKKSKFVSRIIVSTDDTEIASVSKQYGAEVIWRPSDISGDEASSESALLHVLSTLKDHGEELPDLIVFLQCTSPLTRSEDIDSAIRTMEKSGSDTCFSATISHSFLWSMNLDGHAEGINHDSRYRSLRQDMDPQYQENGAIYVMKTKGFIRAEHRFFGKTVPSIMPSERSIDIDSLLDLKFAEFIMLDNSELKD